MRAFGKGPVILQGLWPLGNARIPTEIIAGVTLASLAIPEVMGYTKISGTPVITGLYTILIPAFLYALFGSSRHLVVGADSATAAILASGLAGLAITDPAQYLALSGVLALMAAALLLTARVFELGFLANFLSRSVLIGFLTGVGIQVAMGELGGVLGMHAEGQGPVEKLIYVLSHPGQINLAAALVAALTLAVILGAKRLSPKLPGPLIAVVLMITAGWLFNFEARGIAVLGALPTGLPSIRLPDIALSLNLVSDLIPIAISMFVVILAQSAATSRAYADRYDEPYSANTDLVGLAAANIGAGLTGTFVVNGSPTKTEMLDSAGGRSQLAQIAAAATVLVVLLFLTRPLAFLPEAVLSVIVFLIGLKLVDIRGMAEIRRQARSEFAVALLTALTVVLVDVKEGILLAVVLSLLDHLRHGYRPRNYVLGPGEGDAAQWSYHPVASARQFLPGLIAYHFTHSLYYANMQAFADDIALIENRVGGELRWLCIEASAISGVDFSAAQMLRVTARRMQQTGVRLVLLDVAPQVMTQLERYGLTSQIGPGNFYGSPGRLLLDYRETALPPAPGQ